MPTTYAIPNGRTVMDAVAYTGTNATQSQSLLFQPDFLWFKGRAGTFAHAAFNSVVGRATGLSPNQTYGESTFGTSTAGNDLASFNSNGFTVGAVQNWNSPNNSSANPVVWAWNAGSGSNTTNTTGSITSTVSANATAGFSVVTYTGTGSAATVGHGLGVAPSMIFFKDRTDGTQSWMVYHISTGNQAYLLLNLTNAVQTGSGVWNNTSPTASVFSLGSPNNNCNKSGDAYVAYCWAQVAGYSAFGSYTGNGSSDGPFVYTNFQPKFVMIKRTDTTGQWCMFDTARSPYNVVASQLVANDSSNEDTSGTFVDILSNGFKCRNTAADKNASGGTYVYAAFASNPFKYSNSR